jgi:23S rRNA (guanosine2251-2'-O)-methyltransferase
MNIIVVLDNVRSSFNVGSIFRTADGVGVEQIHLIGITPQPGSDTKLDKTSLSSLGFVKWTYFENDRKWLESITQRSRTLVIAVEEGKETESISLFQLESTLSSRQNFDTIFVVFGHELNGVSPFILTHSDFTLKIPMFGKKNSLNVANCVGIVTYRLREIVSKV